MDQQAQIQISNNPEEELQRVLAALATVFAFNTSATAPSTSPQTREAADRYLTTFQKSSVAWIIADRLLSRESTNDGTSTQIHFFAAQTIHVKCRSDIMQLKGDTNQLNSLRESLMAHLLKFITVQKSGNAGSGAGAIVTRLAMALCSLAVQMQWDTIVTDLLTNLQQQGQGQTQNNQMEMMHLVLEIAQLLPEEATSDRLLLTDENMRHRFVHNLTQSSEKIFQFLLFCVSSNDAGGPSVKIKERVLQCVHSWVRNVRIPPLLLEQTQLFDWIFAILQTNNLDLYGGDMFDISVDVVIEVLRCYPSDHRENMGLVHKLVPKIMALGQDQDSPFQIAVREEEEDAMRDYCRIFTEMGESYMSLIMHHEDLNQVALVELVLACSAIPDNGELIVDLYYMFLNMWHA
jgi:transportin-3